MYYLIKDHFNFLLTLHSVDVAACQRIDEMEKEDKELLELILIIPKTGLKRS